MTYLMMKNLTQKNTRIIIGNPGCGKTTKLIAELKKYLSQGTSLSKIAFCSFSTSAIEEALTRAMSVIPKEEEKKLNYFRTLHSIAFTLLDLSPEQLMTEYHYRQLSDLLCIPLTGMLWTSGKKNIAVIPKRGDRILSVIDSARLRDISIRDYMVNYNSALDFTVATAEDMAQKYEEFKVLNNLYDYTDMLIMAKNKNIETPPLDYLFIDEAQDLSRLQWILVDKMAATTKNIIIAGDDKQEINTFAAADIDTFLNIPGKVEVLKQSYRVPKRIYSKANAVMKKMTKYRKEGIEWLPKDEDGLVRKIKHIPFKAMQKGEWLFLTRTKYQAGRIAEKIMQNMEEGILVFNINGEAPFNTDIYRLIHIFNKINGSILPQKRKALNGNPMLSMINIKDTDSVAIRKQKMDYIRLFKKYISCDTDKKLQPWEITEAFKEKLKEKNWLSAVDKLPFTIKRYVARTAKAYEEKGEELFTKANIRIMTIHAAKGREADNVVVLMDTPKVVQETIANAEDDTEVKVLYVALTRAKKQLCLLTERPNRYSYEYYL